MDYVITNKDKKVYIRLNNNGMPETCVKAVAQKFNNTKANNILNNLPKTLRKFNFMVIPLFEESNKSEEDSRTFIKSEDYVVPEKINVWMDRIKGYNDIVVDVRKRKDELFTSLSNVDRELSNCLHVIELNKWKNGCDGYKEYKKIKTILEKRREIKDELSVVQSISTCLSKPISVEHVVKNLQDRDFTIRETDEGIL